MPYADRDVYLRKQKESYYKNKPAYYWRNIKNKYGMSPEDFNDLFDAQNGGCALCLKPFKTRRGNDLHVDHCHDTGKVRGLLCMPCNVALGMLGDSEEGLIRALNYIKGDSN